MNPGPKPTPFWDRVAIAGPGDCWEWQGARHPDGHGNLKLNGRYYRAHRLAYECSFGPFPVALEVLHRCDNPACCNPRHLFLGTKPDNIADMVSKGRQARGPMLPQTKLTEDQVRAIRIDGRAHTEIAADYGVTPSNIGYIKARKSWSHVA